MKVAVTGASGFIGRHVLLKLSESSCEITAITRKSENLSGFKSKIDIMEMDISLPLENAYELIGKPDILIHLAWHGLPNYKSLHHFETELPVQYRFLSGLVKSGLPNLLVAGTCFEYGMQSGALGEDCEARPSNPYGFAKDTLRHQLGFLKHEHPFNLTWARLFYIYGEGQSEKSLFPQLKKAVENGDKIFNMSGGEQLRDYLSVSEVASYLVSLAMMEKDIGVVNVCSGKPVSVRKLVENWIAEYSWSIKLNLGYYHYADYEPMNFWGDNSKFQKLLRESE